MSEKPVLDFTDDELDRALFGAVLGLEPGALPAFQPEPVGSVVEPSEELRDVSRRIAGQYVEVIANFAAAAFSGRLDRPGCEELLGALDSLERLATASADTRQLELLKSMHQQVERRLARRMGSSPHRFLSRLRKWLDEYGKCLSGNDSERLRRLVTYDRGSLPLLAELSRLRGIGPKRLQRLYCAGLYTVESVANANAQELAQVTGLPTKLSVKVVDAAGQFAVEQRVRCVQELHARSVETAHILVESAGNLDPELAALVVDAFRRLSGVVDPLLGDKE